MVKTLALYIQPPTYAKVTEGLLFSYVIVNTLKPIHVLTIKNILHFHRTFYY